MVKKILSAVAALVLVAGVETCVSNLPYNTTSLTASAADYTLGTYENLTYRKYADHIAISYCEKTAENVVVPDEIEDLPVTVIAESTFLSCKNLISVTLPDSVTDLGANAFAWCSSLKSITIPNSVTSIGFETFSSCSSLTSVTIPDSVTIIGIDAFSYCTSLSDIVIPEGVTKIGEEAFFKCHSLTSINIPHKVTSIGQSAFSDCTSLTEITIPESVTEIGKFAFYNCENLNEITIFNPNCQIYDSVNSISNELGEYNGVIRGYENSTAQAYAEKYGYKFEIIDESSFVLGDVDGDGIVDSSDATLVLIEYSLVQTGGGSSFTPEQFKAADVNMDGTVDSSDASKILAYYADISTGKTPSWD